ncbi:MAG: hypothetical protein NZ839_03000, partial [Endomicrobia bacterium]|nr:hypothetical protein [Endomicrobiia bacterium]
IIKDIICVSSFNNKIWLLDNNYTIYKLKGYREIIKSYKLDFAVGRRISSFLIDDKFLWFVEEGSPHLYCYSKNIFE